MRVLPRAKDLIAIPADPPIPIPRSDNVYLRSTPLLPRPSLRLPCAWGSAARHILHLRGCGGKTLGEGVLNHLFARDAITRTEGWTLGAMTERDKFNDAQERGDAVVATLRHPVGRRSAERTRANEPRGRSRAPRRH